MNNFDQILIYIRPWDVRFHLELARQLAVEFPGVPIRFATFFTLAHEMARQCGFESHYLPAALQAADPSAVSVEKLDELDRQILKETGANLLMHLHSERFMPSGAMAKQEFLRRHVAVLDALVKPRTLSIGAMYDHFVYWLGGSLANARQGAHFAFVGAPMPPGRVQALRTPWSQWQGPEDPDADKLYDECKSSLALPPEQRIEYMRANPIPPLRTRWRQRLREVKTDKLDQRNGSYFGPASFTIKNSIMGRWSRAFPSIRESDFDITTVEQVKAFPHRCVYVPLHMEPEATIFMYSPWMRDQVEMCRLVSQALPPDVWLLVKENPKMLETRSRAFIRALKELPNVRYVHPRVLSYDMIQKCDLTLTLAGSAALEAKLMGRRIAVTSRPPYAEVLNDQERVGIQISPDQIRERLESQPEPLSRSAWRFLLAGTFKGKSVPVWGSQTIEVDNSTENARSYVIYITACIERYSQLDLDRKKKISNGLQLVS